MFGLVKISRLGRQIQPQCSVLLRNSSHFTYVPDAPVQDMGKLCVRNLLQTGDILTTIKVKTR